MRIGGRDVGKTWVSFLVVPEGLEVGIPLAAFIPLLSLTGSDVVLRFLLLLWETDGLGKIKIIHLVDSTSLNQHLIRT